MAVSLMVKQYRTRRTTAVFEGVPMNDAWSCLGIICILSDCEGDFVNWVVHPHVSSWISFNFEREVECV